jgi:hypothetical protein
MKNLDFYPQIVTQQNLPEIIEYALANQDNDRAMTDIWAGFIIIRKDEMLLEKGLLPQPQYGTIEHIFSHYNCQSKESNYWKQKMLQFTSLLDGTEEGKKSIVKDIERYFSYYGKVIVGYETWPLIETIYQRYAPDTDKIHYLKLANQLKFFNTLPIALMDVATFQKITIPSLEKVVHTSYWNRLAKLKFSREDSQEQWKDFCKKFKLYKKIDNAVPEKESDNLDAVRKHKI